MKRFVVIPLVAMFLVPPPAATPASVQPLSLSVHPTNSPRVSRTTWRIPTKWLRLARCESNLRPHANRHNTYYGMWQIHKGWFKPFHIDPSKATIYQQYQVAEHVYKTQGAKAWTCANKTKFG